MAINISFNDYSPPPPPKEEVNLIVGIFFDGTSNNRYNIEGRRKNKMLKNSGFANDSGASTSFGNDHSNVDRLQTIYPDKEYIFSIYMDGIGTKNPEINKDGSLSYYGDFIRGQGYGTGETGLKEKVRKGATDLITKLNDKAFIKIDSLTLDLFGFSRGAAAARMFANEIWKYNEGEEDIVLQEIKKSEILLIPKKIKLRFLGLYDTVSSFNESNFSSDTVYDDQIKNKLLLKLNKQLGFVVHLTAENEYRQMFPVTNCNSMTSGTELILPGCHSDIGGGYLDGADEDVVIAETNGGDPQLKSNEGKFITIVDYERQRMLDQGWYRKNELVKSFPGTWVKGKRDNLSNKYSFVILHLMAEFGEKKYKIPWKTEILEDFPVPANLKTIQSRLKSYAFEGKNQPKYYTMEYLQKEKKQVEEKRLKKQLTQKEVDIYNQKANDHITLWTLRNKFLHFSASMDGIGMEPLKNEKTRKMEEDRFKIEG